MILHIESAGMLSTIQDTGRLGFRAYGLPSAGAMDARALAVANILVGNPEDAAALELTLLGPSLRAEGEGTLALAGADLGARLNGWPLPATGSFGIRDGDRLTFGNPQRGCRSYLAAAGGFDLPWAMGSHSTYLRGAIGGYHGRALARGDSLKVREACSPPLYIGAVPPRLVDHLLPQRTAVRVILGPQDDFFDAEQIALFFSTTWQIGNEADRMGYRLSGGALKHRDKKEIVSDGALPGAIQVPGHGTPIVLLADAQTTGGYPKIATVISADLGLFGQLKPGDSMRFAAVDQDQARVAWQEEQKRRDILASWLKRSHAAAPKYFRVAINKADYLVTWQGIETGE